ncbi:MAG: Nramp family divalent metal transporter [Chloroflexi bacterium]|nr:Nramp family divalent metal transporter [Chloroflexota bacterium]MBV9598914.1 Nramp family divalent metal transporter [Chloroflexota bacterium]
MAIAQITPRAPGAALLEVRLRTTARLSSVTPGAPRRLSSRLPLGHFPGSPIWRRLLAVFAVLGPGLIAGAAGDDAGGIATYASVGAQYGYTLLWALGLITVSLIVVQIQVARLGVITGKGLAELIREQFGVRWSALAMFVLLIANGAVTIAEFAGIAAAGGLFGIPPLVSVPVAAVVVWLIVVRSSYSLAEKVFLVLGAALLTYVGAAVLAGPSWGQVAVESVTPSFYLDAGYLTTLITLVGTTITPYMLFYLQSSISDKGLGMADYASERTDVVLGSVLSDLIAAFIVICTAATLFVAGIQVSSADDAARALEPLAGPYARVLFGLGLFGASMLAASVLPLSTAYAICGAFGWERGVSHRWRQAPVFNGLYTGLIAVAAAFVLVPGLPLIQVILATQTLNGVLLPVVLVFVVRLANNRSLLQQHTNSRAFNVLAVGTTVVLIVLTAALLVSAAFGTS